MIDVTGMKWKKVKESKVVYFDIGKTLADTFKIPILVTGGIKDLNVANEALNKSNIQYIGISRALLSEPDIIVKWKNCENKKSQCVRCMKCYDFDFNKDVQCIININKNKKKAKAKAKANNSDKKDKMKASKLGQIFIVIALIFAFLFLIAYLPSKFRENLYKEKDKKDEEELVDFEDKEKN